MIPVVTALRLTPVEDRDALPLLVLGPSLGTSAATLWGDAATHLADHFDVVAWDLPGHGRNRSVPEEPWSMADLAVGVLTTVDEVLAERGDVGGTFGYAGDSVGGAVGLQLLLDAPSRVSGAVLLCTGAQIGTAESWTERIDLVGSAGTPALVTASAQRWFGPGFLDREPSRGSALLHALQEVDDTGYAQVCAALAGFDVRDRLGEISAPVLAVAGSVDVATPPDKLREVADGVRHGRFVELDGVAHLAPAEAPEEVARLVRRHLVGDPDGDGSRTLDEVHAAGMVVRREVLGDAHVDRATAATTDLDRDFQELITRYAWGSIWTRTGLDRRSRSLITLTALVARGHHEELAMHLRAARTNGVTVEEIKELLLQTAIYCGVPDANTAFRIAREVLSEEPAEKEAPDA
ncbi:3-oxoadipate enol-lactonase / 4-carboxymuconolactone decarboxylase [Nocardioides alpinus]|uniref:4-carboxymuconolactone decarboxylase n=1 Tax=Nocardioides alpinus TaxID=748909 RepID=A0A1I0XWV0_9ACTN|nr:4-carboxymuconolactone decarboxylase [Nocardioides alpinus]PKH42824.1 4-carboxymuconolactone decarboxylase [Nocardioides alpinus]SFB04926.1 3-oxoadipate enol-lactonase / 4-carboxymuconolactone decarboxylase [Nocardioides alpinus]